MAQCEYTIQIGPAFRNTQFTGIHMSDQTIAPWRTIVASSLDWKQAHATFEEAVKDVSPSVRGKRPPGFPHSPWELLEHIRIAQHDLLEFMDNPEYQAPKWPDDYWPESPEPPGEHAWDESVASMLKERAAVKGLATRKGLDLSGKIPWGTGQTYLRTLLVIVDHTSYHVGQLVDARRLLGNWPEE
jgi:uncharacterized damage-inducible protein DinB